MDDPVSKPVIYLTLNDVVRMHLELMEDAGASSVLLDEGKLGSAVLRAEHSAFYAGADIFQQAASLSVGIALAHAFVDGNKPLGYAAGLTLLWVNGIRITANHSDLADALLAAVNRSQESLDSATERFAAYLRTYHISL